MKNTLFALSAVLVLCAAAPPIREAAIDFVEAQVKKTDGWHLGSKDTAVKLDGVLYVDQRQGNAGSYGGCDGGAGICYSGRGTVDYDFPSLAGSTVGNNIVCADSNSITVTGCKLSDTLSMGIDQVRVNSYITFTPYMTATDTAVVQACCNGITDGGSCNQPDSGFWVRCLR